MNGTEVLSMSTHLRRAGQKRCDAAILPRDPQAEARAQLATAEVWEQLEDFMRWEARSWGLPADETENGISRLKASFGDWKDLMDGPASISAAVAAAGGVR